MKLKFCLVSPVKHLMIVFSLMLVAWEEEKLSPFHLQLIFPGVFWVACMKQHIKATLHSLQHCAGCPEATLYLHNPQLPQDIFLTEVMGLWGLDLTHPTWSPSVFRVKLLLQREEEAPWEMFIITVKWQGPFLSPPFPAMEIVMSAVVTAAFFFLCCSMLRLAVLGGWS